MSSVHDINQVSVDLSVCRVLRMIVTKFIFNQKCCYTGGDVILSKRRLGDTVDMCAMDQLDNTVN